MKPLKEPTPSSADVGKAGAWLPIKRWNGRYEVSSEGKVRRLDGFFPKQWVNQNGYLMVRLSSPRAIERVHRLVAECFIPNPHQKPCVNHLNNNPADNHVENLEWCTQRENIAHADAQGRMQRNFWTGKRSPNAKLTDKQVSEIKLEYRTGKVSWRMLADKFTMSKRAIGRILRGENYADVR